LILGTAVAALAASVAADPKPRRPSPQARRILAPNATTIAPHVKAAAARYGVSERLVFAIIRVESGFNPRAVSSKGARGLMQLAPGTAAVLGVRNAFDPMQNINGGVRHLRGLMDRWDNNLPLVLAAYNAGEQAVIQHGGVPPYPETQDYVARVLRLLADDPVYAASRPAARKVARVAPPAPSADITAPRTQGAASTERAVPKLEIGPVGDGGRATEWTTVPLAPTVGGVSYRSREALRGIKKGDSKERVFDVFPSEWIREGRRVVKLEGMRIRGRSAGDTLIEIGEVVLAEPPGPPMPYWLLFEEDRLLAWGRPEQWKAVATRYGLGHIAVTGARAPGKEHSASLR
jgi:hypothetical protein